MTADDRALRRGAATAPSDLTSLLGPVGENRQAWREELLELEHVNPAPPTRWDVWATLHRNAAERLNLHWPDGWTEGLAERRNSRSEVSMIDAAFRTEQWGLESLQRLISAMGEAPRAPDRDGDWWPAQVRQVTYVSALIVRGDGPRRRPEVEKLEIPSHWLEPGDEVRRLKLPVGIPPTAGEAMLLDAQLFGPHLIRSKTCLGRVAQLAARETGDAWEDTRAALDRHLAPLEQGVGLLLATLLARPTATAGPDEVVASRVFDKAWTRVRAVVRSRSWGASDASERDRDALDDGWHPDDWWEVPAPVRRTVPGRTGGLLQHLHSLEQALPHEPTGVVSLDLQELHRLPSPWRPAAMVAAAQLSERIEDIADTLARIQRLVAVLDRCLNLDWAQAIVDEPRGAEGLWQEVALRLDDLPPWMDVMEQLRVDTPRPGPARRRRS